MTDKKTPAKKTAAKKKTVKKKAPAKKKATTKKGAKCTSRAQVKQTQAEMIEEFEKRTGQDTVFTEQIAAEICSRISSGESLRSICRDDKMPGLATVHRWILFCDTDVYFKTEALRARLTIFRDHYNRARIMQAEGMVDECSDISDDSANDYMTRTYGNTEVEVPNPEILNRSKLRVETRKWLAEIYLPKIQAMRDKNLNLKTDQPINLNFDSQDADA